MPDDLSRADVPRRLPRKRIGAGVLFFNESGEVLLVNPTYKEYWEVPGGMTEVGEAPRTAAKREVREELGVDVDVERLLVLDWNPPGYLPATASCCSTWVVGSVFVRSALRTKSLSGWCWCSRASMRERLPDFKARRVIAGMDAWERGWFVELEDGWPVDWKVSR